MIEYENLHKSNLPFMEEYQEEFKKFLDSGWFILGENIKLFEEEFANFIGAKHCIGVASGLDALILSINALNLPKGSEIIVPSNTYIATILAIIRNGFTPILVEPDIQTYNIDPSKIEERLTAKTKAVIVVHLYGKMCPMDEITKIAQEYRLYIIEDCAQAHNAKYKNQQAGTFGIGCFSFYPTKNLGALGDAGAITTNDQTLADRLRALRNYGSFIKYHNQYCGFNSRLDELQASFLRIKLQKLEEITQHKRRLANLYLTHLDSSKFILPKVSEDFYDVYHIFNIRHNRRDELKKYLLTQNIITDIHYPIPPHKQEAMKGIIFGEYPIAQTIHQTTLSLPIAYFHTENQIFQVIEKLNQWTD